MKIYNNANLSKKHCDGVIAIGNFDGLHLVIKKLLLKQNEKLKKTISPLGP